MFPFSAICCSSLAHSYTKSEALLTDSLLFCVLISKMFGSYRRKNYGLCQDKNSGCVIQSLNDYLYILELKALQYTVHNNNRWPPLNEVMVCF